MFQSGDVPEAVKRFILKYRDPFIILDESSKIKTNNAMAENKKSKRSQAVKKLNTIGDRAIATGTFRETSSFWDTAQFTTFLEYKINELEQMGLDRWNDGEVKALIDDFKSE